MQASVIKHQRIYMQHTSAYTNRSTCPKKFISNKWPVHSTSLVYPIHLISSVRKSVATDQLKPGRKVGIMNRMIAYQEQWLLINPVYVRSVSYRGLKTSPRAGLIIINQKSCGCSPTKIRVRRRPTTRSLLAWP